MKKIKILLTAFLLAVLGGIAFCQPADSLSTYLEIAAKNNPSILQKYAEYQAALQKVPQVGSLPDPELSTGIFLSPMELVGGNQLADIRLMQMFPWFGVLKAAKDEMGLMARAKFESFREAKLELYFEVQQSWYGLYKIQRALEISQKNVEILRSLERLSLVRFKVSGVSGGSNSSDGGSFASSVSQGNSGMQTMGGTSKITAQSSSRMQGTAASQQGSAAPKQESAAKMQGSGEPMSGSTSGSGLADLYRIQMEANEMETNIAGILNQQTTLIARFNSLLNRPPQSRVLTPDTLKSEVTGIPLAAVQDSLLANNPMLWMLDYESKAIDVRKQMVTKMGYPMVGLGLNYSLIKKNPMSTSSMNGKDMVMPMVTVTLPIYRKKFRAMQTEMDFLKTANQQGIQAARNSLQSEYWEAVQNYEDAMRRMELYNKQFKLAKKSLNILMVSFSTSGAGLNDLLQVRRQTLDYELKETDAISDFNTSIARLKRLANIQVNENSGNRYK